MRSDLKYTRLDTSGIRKIREGLKVTVDKALMNTAMAVAVDAADRAPKDTEFLAESIHVVAAEYSQYEISRTVAEEKFEQAKAVGRTPKGHRLGTKAKYNFLPEIKPSNPNEVWVVVGASYGMSVEFGVKGRQPFLAPAVYQNRGTLTNEIRMALDGLSVKAQITKFSTIGD